MRPNGFDNASITPWSVFGRPVLAHFKLAGNVIDMHAKLDDIQDYPEVPANPMKERIQASL